MSGPMLDHGTYLTRCVELAREALDDGDDPTAHPELDLARWAWRNLDAQLRTSATGYTSGEHEMMFGLREEAAATA